jgi:hypothetical protein
LQKYSGSVETLGRDNVGKQLQGKRGRGQAYAEPGSGVAIFPGLWRTNKCRKSLKGFFKKTLKECGKNVTGPAYNPSDGLKVF